MPSQATTQPCKTAIIGGGLVGSLCACFMARRGHVVTVFEKRKDVRKSTWEQGKSINLSMSNRARKSLRTIGIEDEVLSKAVPMMGRLVHDVSGATKFLPYDPKDKECLYSIGRNLLNGILLAAAESNPNIDLHFEHKFMSVDLEDGQAILENLKTKEVVSNKFDFLIGADGAHSTLRKELQSTNLFSFRQTYIQHGYVELTMDSQNAGSLRKNCLHLWPRKSFMLIAMPNPDGSFTATLFMPYRHFENFQTSQGVVEFFHRHFPDAVPLLGEDQLADLVNSKPRSLVSISCDPYDFGGKMVLIGDAAHAMVPFYGQGMNAGFEDCFLLDALLEKNDDDVEVSVRDFAELRRDDAHAICELSMYNYVEMRNLVTQTSYYLRKMLDDFLYGWLSTMWVPLYVSVTFTDMNYTTCVENRKWQDKILRNTAFFIFFVIIAFLAVLVYFE